MSSLFTDPPASLFTTRPSGAQQWQSAIEEQRQRELMRPSAAQQVEAGSRVLRNVAGDFTKGGLTEILRGQGVELPDWSNRASNFMQSEPVNMALGVMTPMKSATARVAARVVPMPKGERIEEGHFEHPNADARTGLMNILYPGREQMKDEIARVADAEWTHRLEQESGFYLVRDPAERERMGLPPIPVKEVAKAAPEGRSPWLDIFREKTGK